MSIFPTKTAFLHGDLPEDERIYMEQPPGFEDPSRPDDIWEVLKGIYGTKQAGRVWNKRLNADMTTGFGFHRVSAEHCLYFRHAENGNFALASIHVDDTTAVGHKEELDRLEQDLRSRYEITVSDGSYKPVTGCAHRERLQQTDPKVWKNFIIESTSKPSRCDCPRLLCSQPGTRCSLHRLVLQQRCPTESIS
jgi:hypothetical protein